MKPALSAEEWADWAERPVAAPNEHGCGCGVSIGKLADPPLSSEEIRYLREVIRLHKEATGPAEWLTIDGTRIKPVKP